MNYSTSSYMQLGSTPKVAQHASGFDSYVVFPPATVRVELTPTQCELVLESTVTRIEILELSLDRGFDVASEIRSAISILVAVGHDFTENDCPSTLAYVEHALSNYGYLDSGLSAAYFVGMTSSGKEQHAVEFEDEDADGGVGRSYVYIWQRERDGRIVGDF